MVKDSSKGFADQPYTLMLLNQGKVTTLRSVTKAMPTCLAIVSTIHR